MKRLWMIALLIAATGCDPTRGMETRTFTLHRLSGEEALALLTPYVRDGGRLSTRRPETKGSADAPKFVTVTEQPERLKAIEELLAKYDGSQDVIDVMLHVQVIEADGFTARDSAIADIEQTLRQTFRYRGYRLVGEAHIQAREGSTFRRSIGTAHASGLVGRGYMLEGRVDRVATSETGQQVPIDIQLLGPTEGGYVDIASTITGTMGRPTVLGQSAGAGAVILVIRPSIASN